MSQATVSSQSRDLPLKDPFRSLGLAIFAMLFAGSGIAHFALTKDYVRIMPPYLPWPQILVYMSGALELIGGLGLLYRPVRRVAAWGLIVLLIAVFPANLYMATAHVGYDGPAWVLWARLPLQIPLIGWAYYYTRPAIMRRGHTR